MKIKIENQKWFQKAPLHQVIMLGIKHLVLPADRMNDTKKDETFKRAMVRQAFTANHEYGAEFEIPEPVNPFGAVVKTRRGGQMIGEYRFVKNGLRVPENDVRWEIAKVLEENTRFEDVTAYFDDKYGKGHVFKATEKQGFTIKDQLNWSLKRGWIIKV